MSYGKVVSIGNFTLANRVNAFYRMADLVHKIQGHLLHKSAFMAFLLHHWVQQEGEVYRTGISSFCPINSLLISCGTSAPRPNSISCNYIVKLLG